VTVNASDQTVVATAAAVRSEATSRLIIDIATAASAELGLDQILHETLGRLRTVVALTGGSIALVEGDDLVVRAAIGPFAGEALGQRVGRGPNRSWSVVLDQRAIRSGDLVGAGVRIHGKTSGPMIRSWLAVPLIRRGTGIGLIEVDSTEPNAFTDEDEGLLMTVANVLAGHVELAAHHAEELRTSELRDAFISVISHELRTPITTIYGLALFLRRRGHELDPANLAKAIQDVEEESDRLYRLVEDLLVLSRAERGRVEVDTEPVNLGRLMKRIVDAESDRHPDRVFELDVAPRLALVEAEPTYIEQVARNFVSNAVKYSQTPTPIVVTVGEDGDEVVVRVLDQGIGIDGDGADPFELFYRSKSASRIAPGAGIGLFVCRQLMAAMSGRTWLRRRDDGIDGSEAGFALPVTVVEADDDDAGAVPA
jgi:K+-sensing histidine kinase KdpD